jgi:hypothetical protein
MPPMEDKAMLDVERRHTATLDTYLQALGRKFGEQAAPK